MFSKRHENLTNPSCSLQFPESLPNADSHFAVGDAVSWSGIKRSGNAHIMGQFAATNIVQMLIAVEDGGNSEEAKLAACPPFKSMMSLAIGEQAIGMRFGLMYGKEVKERAFGRGLGIDSEPEKRVWQQLRILIRHRHASPFGDPSCSCRRQRTRIASSSAKF